MSDFGRTRSSPLGSWRLPLVTAVGMSAAVALVALVYPRPGALVLVGVLAMTLSRSRLLGTWRGRAEAVVVLPVVGLATFGVGELLRIAPIAGAALFILAMFTGVWLRRFGAGRTRAGSLLALPFLTLLIVPGGGAGTPVWGVIVLSLVALVVVVFVRVLAEVARLVPRPQPSAAEELPQRASSLRPQASTRMAIQLAIALAAAFVVGALVFPDHITWVVLTAYLVCSGNRGRADVLHKSGLRIVGAAAGTLLTATGLAALVRADLPIRGQILTIVVLALLAVGLWLRELTYAAWALVVTLVITLLQGVAFTAPAAPVGFVVWERVLAIVVGALIGVAASWFVLPVRSGAILRRRISETLAALNDFVAEPSPRTDAVVGLRLDRLDEVARPWHALARLTPHRAASARPGQWLRLVHAIAELLRRDPDPSAEARRALGAARASVRDPAAIGPALTRLRNALIGD